VKLLDKALARLGALPDGLGGVAVASFRDGAARARQALERWRDGGSPVSPEPPAL
jgi:hypothetical protein